VRSTVSKLRAPAEREPSLAASIAHLADDFEQATQLAVTVSLEEDLPPLPEQRRQALFLATQEALTNIQRHAQARVATITLRNAEGYSKVTINIEDDGQGMTAGSIANGFGLRGMKERIEHLGGNVDIDSALTKGTRVHVTLPIGDDRDSA
jgi:signal transduction histidine kinase